MTQGWNTTTEKAELFTIEKKEHDKLSKVMHGAEAAGKKLLFSSSRRKSTIDHVMERKGRKFRSDLKKEKSLYLMRPQEMLPL